MQTFRYSFLAAAALLGTLSASAAQADNFRVLGSSAVDVFVPNALTDGGQFMAALSRTVRQLDT